MTMTGEELRATYPALMMSRHERGNALRLLRLRDQVHPNDVAGAWYPDREAAEAYAAGNLEHHGHPSLGIYEDVGRWAGVTDLRPCLYSHGGTATDPGKPDGEF